MGRDAHAHELDVLCPHGFTDTANVEDKIAGILEKEARDGAL